MDFGIKETLEGSVAGLFGGAIGYLLGAVGNHLLSIPDLQVTYTVLGFLGVFLLYALDKM